MQQQDNDGVPANIDDLVKFISSAVRSHFEKSGRPMDGSQLAYLIRTEFPSLEYEKLGLTRLGDAVRIAECQHLVQRNRDAKHLELSPPDATQTVTEQDPSSERNRLYVRSDIWRAFVHHAKSQKFLHRDSNEVEIARNDGVKRSTVTKPAEGLVEIQPIPESTKIDWAKDFLSTTLAKASVSEAEAKSLASGQTSEVDSTTRRSWKLALASHVVDYIQAWATDNDVPTDKFLLPVKSRVELKKIEPGSAESEELRSLRQAIVASINEMPMADLENLTLPIKYIRRHFRPI